MMEYTVEELEQMLAQKKQKQSAKRKAEREAYELDRDQFVNRMMSDAIAYSGIMKDFKQELTEAFEAHAEKLANYGGIRTNSKGGFSLTTSDNKYRIRRKRSTTPEWDERSKKGEEMILSFLKEKITDEAVHKLVMSFLERNEAGELEYSRVMNLLKMKDEFDDKRWLNGLELVQESYSISLRSYSYEFFEKTEEGKWESVSINFSSI